MAEGQQAVFQKLYDFDREKKKSQTRYLAGIDEVGRGCLAGPVVAACVLIDINKPPIEGVNDSKKLSANQRESLSHQIISQSLVYAISAVDNHVIDEINIRQATLKAMTESLNKVSSEHQVDEIWVDGETIQTPLFLKKIIKGDAHSYVIAAASIVAKVWRDRLMIDLHKECPEYGFDQHKGYGTKYHRLAIEKNGGSSYHRWSFQPLKGLKNEPVQ